MSFQHFYEKTTHLFLWLEKKVLTANPLNKESFGGKFLVSKKPISFFPFSLSSLKFGLYHHHP